MMSTPVLARSSIYSPANCRNLSSRGQHPFWGRGPPSRDSISVKPCSPSTVKVHSHTPVSSPFSWKNLLFSSSIPSSRALSALSVT